MSGVKIVAELGCNHQGDVGIAKKMIEAAASCGVDYVKFQKRNPKECLSPERYGETYASEHSFGRTYGEHREKLELPLDAHYELMKYAHTLGVSYACSVWDVTSLRDVLSLSPDYIKIPSAHNEDFKLIDAAFRLTDKPVHISNGMTTSETEHEWLRLALMRGRSIVPYVCTSTYPCRMEDVCLTDGCRMEAAYGISEWGFSGHHLGIALDIAAYTLGASWIERHFTLDRSMKGRDQAASLEPGAMRKLVRDIRAVESAWHDRTGVLDCERLELKRKMRSEAG